MVSDNLCQGGAGASGYAGGVAAGGGIGNDHLHSTAIITNSTVSLNGCLGGAGGAGANGGDAVGAGIENAVYAFAFGITDTSSLVLSTCQIVGNVAQGGTEGSSAVGGDGLGGGIFVGSGTAILQGVLVSGPQCQRHDGHTNAHRRQPGLKERQRCLGHHHHRAMRHETGGGIQS